MRWASGIALLVTWIAITSLAHADPPRRRGRGVESSAALGDPHVPFGRARVAAGGGRTPATNDSDEETTRTWGGPRVELGYVHYALKDSNGGGSVNAISIGGYLATRALRLGILGDAGSRYYAFDENDIALRLSAIVGYQALNALLRLTPYIAARFDWGVLIRQRFNTTVTDGIYGVGVEAGFDINPSRTFHVGAAVGISLLDVHDLSFVSWSVRLFFGL